MEELATSISTQGQVMSTQTDILAEALGKAISALESARPTPPDTYRMNWQEITDAEIAHCKECKDYQRLIDELSVTLASYRTEEAT